MNKIRTIVCSAVLAGGLVAQATVTWVYDFTNESPGTSDTSVRNGDRGPQTLTYQYLSSRTRSVTGSTVQSPPNWTANYAALVSPTVVWFPENGEAGTRQVVIPQGNLYWSRVRWQHVTGSEYWSKFIDGQYAGQEVRSRDWYFSPAIDFWFTDDTGGSGDPG